MQTSRREFISRCISLFGIWIVVWACAYMPTALYLLLNYGMKLFSELIVIYVLLFGFPLALGIYYIRRSYVLADKVIASADRHREAAYNPEELPADSPARFTLSAYSSIGMLFVSTASLLLPLVLYAVLRTEVLFKSAQTLIILILVFGVPMLSGFLLIRKSWGFTRRTTAAIGVEETAITSEQADPLEAASGDPYRLKIELSLITALGFMLICFGAISLAKDIPSFFQSSGAFGTLELFSAYYEYFLLSTFISAGFWLILGLFCFFGQRRIAGWLRRIHAQQNEISESVS